MIGQIEQAHLVLERCFRASRCQLLALLGAMSPDGIPDNLQADTLKRLLSNLKALAYWMPSSHKDAKTCLQLYKVCKGLLTIPETGTRSRLLVYCFRQLSDSSHKVAGEVLTTLTSRLPFPNKQQNHSGELLSRQMHNCIEFLVEVSPRLGTRLHCGKSVNKTRILEKLCSLPGYWKQEANASLLQVHWEHRVRVLAGQLADSHWTIAHWCENGGEQGSRYLVAMAEVANQPDLLQACKDLYAALIRLHASKNAPDELQMKTLLKCMFDPLQLAAQGRSFLIAEVSNTAIANPENDKALAEALERELKTGHQCILALCSERHASGEQDRALRQKFVILSARLQWVMTEAGLHAAGIFFSCCHEVLGRYWFCKLQWPGQIVDILQVAAKLLAGNDLRLVENRIWVSLQTRVLSLWPRKAYEEAMPVRVEENSLVQLGSVPRLLSSSLDALVNYEEDWFKADFGKSVHIALLMKELTMLERGAAAVHLSAIEALCARLLYIYGVLQDPVLDVTVPVKLLCNAHCKLLEMMDSAAAWHEPRECPRLNQDLDSWLDVRRHAGVGESCPGSWTALFGELRNYVASLGKLLDLPVRLETAMQEELPALFEAEVLMTALQVLVRAILLDISNSAELRRQKHLPAVTVLYLRPLRLEDGWEIHLSDDSGIPAPASRDIELLRRKLPRQITLVKCVIQGPLRNFSASLPLHPEYCHSTQDTDVAKGSARV